MFLWSMRQYRDNLIKNGYTVYYHSIDEESFYDKYEDKTEPSLSSLPSVTFVTSGMARVWAACDGGGIPITRKPIFRHPSSPNGNKDEFETSSPILPAGATFSFDALMVQVVEHDDAKIAVTFYHIGSSSSKMMSSLSNASSSSSSTSTAFSLSSSSSLPSLKKRSIAIIVFSPLASWVARRQVSENGPPRIAAGEP